MANKLIRRLRLASLLVASTLVVSACTGNEAPGQAGNGAPGQENEDVIGSMSPITFTVAQSSSETSSLGQALTAALDEITERTDGKVTFEVYWSNSLVPSPEFLSAVGTGVADMASLSNSIYSQELPIANWVLGLGGAASPDFPLDLLSGVPAFSEMFTGNEDINQEYESNNVRLLNAYNSPRFNMLCSKPIDGAESVQGLKARAGGAVWASEAEALGIASSFVPNTEIYESIQRGLLDCAILPASVLDDLALWEVAKYFVPASFSGFPGVSQVMNLDKWNALPTEVQKIFDEAMNTTMITEWIKSDLAGYKDFAKRGVAEFEVEFQDPSELNAVLTKLQANVIDEMPGSAPTGFSDPRKFIEEYLAELEKWEKLVAEDAGIEIVSDGPNPIYESFVKDYDLKAYLDAFDAQSSRQ